MHLFLAGQEIEWSEAQMNGQTERTDDEIVESKDEPKDAMDASAEIEPEAADNNDSEEATDTEADPLAELQAKADENWDKYLRAAAELENVRKRATRDVEKARKFALERFSGDLLAVRDSLEMGLASADDSDAEQLLAGSEATLKLFAKTMEQYGVTEIDPHGEPFDPELHEAMTMQPSADAEPGSVLTVFQKGYQLNGRLLRPARVVVAQELADNGSETDK